MSDGDSKLQPPAARDSSSDAEKRRQELIAKFESMDGEKARQQIAVLPYYHAIENAITKPNQGTFVTRYFRTKWIPTLGNEAASIVQALRFHADRETGVTWAGYEAIADAAGLSVRAVERWLSHIPPKDRSSKWLERWTALHTYFVLGKSKRYNPVAKGTRIEYRRTTNKMRVAMDDPVHPDDTPQFFVLAAERMVQEESNALKNSGDSRNRPAGGNGEAPYSVDVEFGNSRNRPAGAYTAPPVGRSGSSSYRISSTSAKREISPKQGSPQSRAFAKDPRVANLTREKRAENDAFVAELCAWINDKEGSLDGGHQYEGLFRRGVYFVNDIPEIRLMQRRLSDELQDEYGHHTPKQGTVSRRLWGYIKRFAAQNDIDLTPSTEEPSEAK